MRRPFGFSIPASPGLETAVLVGVEVGGVGATAAGGGAGVCANVCKENTRIENFKKFIFIDDPSMNINHYLPGRLGG